MAAISLIRPNTCRNCTHSRILPDVPVGEPEAECKGAPPQVVALMVPTAKGPALSMQTLFPRVQLDWDCGMWRAKIVTPLS